MSVTSHNTAALQQRLAGTGAGPSDLYDLMVRHYADPGAVEVLCDHAAGSFPLLVALFAGSKHPKECPPSWSDRKNQLAPLELFDAQVKSLAGAMFAHATEAGLLEGLRTARSGLPGGSPATLGTVSRWFAAHAPLEALTDRVTAEMSRWPMEGLSPELGAGPSNSAVKPLRYTDTVCDRISWLMSRYLYNRFGDHGPSWEMFKNLYDPSQTVVDIADIVAAVEHA